MSFDEIGELKEKKLCQNCVGEEYLKDEIQKLGKYHICSYCGEKSKSYSIGDLADRFGMVFDQHYYRTSDQPKSWELSLLADKEVEYEWDREGWPVIDAIQNAADIPEVAANDIQQILEYRYYDFEACKMGDETEFSSGSYYSEKKANDWEWQEAWRRFEISLKTEGRFFNGEAIDHLKSIFEGIDQMQTHDGESLIIDGGPGTMLTDVYRARVFQNDDKLKEALMRPDLHLGPPPQKYANPGRMNAHGISVFYGANQPGVALAEVRPPVGSKVMVARFEITRAIRLLDLTALKKVHEYGSIFDSSFIERIERAKFLRSLNQRITKPVMPNDEPFDYLSTQAIADFLSTNRSIEIDGIVYPSVQVGNASLNIVLFQKAAKVEELEFPDGTALSASLWQQYEEGWERDFTVIEEVPKKNADKSEPKDTFFGEFLIDQIERDDDIRQRTLKIDLDSVNVHVIQSLQIIAEEFSVSRHRWEKNIVPDF